MADPIITLTTDFGDSPYVAAMKGVILGINPQARLVDLSHQIPPQNVRHAAYFLAASIPYFPPAAIHVVVVDPGVGSERRILLVEIDQQRLLVPDNGCWTKLTQRNQAVPQVRCVEATEFWRQPVSSTFHGRDIFGPVAGHLSLGIDPARLGPVVQEWVTLPLPRVEESVDGLRGEVEFVDHFGNLISNIPAGSCPRPASIIIATHTVRRLVRTYSDGAPGELVALTSSEGMLEIAVNQGSAAQLLGAGVGTPVGVVDGSN